LNKESINEDDNYLMHDILTLQGLFKSSNLVTLNFKQEKFKSFTQDNGVDFPNYILLDRAEEVKKMFGLFYDDYHSILDNSSSIKPSTFEMGLVGLEFNEELNELTVSLRRPGLLIGKGGKGIKELEDFLGCKVKVKEVIIY
jgi:hypothetical protein